MILCLQTTSDRDGWGRTPVRPSPEVLHCYRDAESRQLASGEGEPLGLCQWSMNALLTPFCGLQTATQGLRVKPLLSFLPLSTFLALSLGSRAGVKSEIIHQNQHLNERGWEHRSCGKRSSTLRHAADERK